MSINLGDLVYRIALDDSDLNVAAARAAQGVDKVGASVRTAAQQMPVLARGVALTRAETLALNYTLSDVAASLASGASPFTILLQQGGQLKDSFGGIWPLFTRLAGAINPMTAAVGLGAAAVGGLGYAAYRAAEQHKELRDTIAMTGNAAG